MPNSAISLAISASLGTSSPIKFSKDDTLQYCGPIKLKLRNNKRRKYWFQSGKWVRSSLSDINSIPKLNAESPGLYNSCLTTTAFPIEDGTCSVVVADKLPRLVSEFKSLPDPIDRVKRLLHYAALLPPLEDSARVQENRVKGCATQVWLVSEMDECGRMRFKADSDSEISKGFCSCLIWMLDGAEPWEVLMVEREDLEDLNVGLHGKAQSRVNTWHNVLFSMQKAAKALHMEMEKKPPLDDLPSLIVTSDNSRKKENFAGLRMEDMIISSDFMLPYVHVDLVLRLPVLRYPFYSWFSVKLVILQVGNATSPQAKHIGSKSQIIHCLPEVASFNEGKGTVFKELK